MSRPPAKRKRFNSPSPEEEPSSHIFASSTNPTPSANAVLRPCSFEITLNHNTELKRSLHLAPPSTQIDEERPGWGTRLVTWISSSDDHTITTDRYDAIHLLQHLPAKLPPTASSQKCKVEDDTGWSDLDSDTEDIFYMTDAEAADFTHTKAKARLEAHHTTRLANLLPPTLPSVPTTPRIETERSSIPDVDAGPRLSRSQFDLMAKTARVLANSTNASMLELKILANHGGDDRFSFLRKSKQEDKNQDISRVWKELQKAKGEMSYVDALQLLQPPPATTAKDKMPTPSSLNLVAYDDSDSESESQPQAKQTEAKAETQTVAETIPHTMDPDKKHRQAERLARAKEWLKTRSKPPPSTTTR